jgi:opacity protein-like surface antigen
MRIKIFAIALVCFASSLQAQVPPSAMRRGGLPLEVGAGYSSFDVDWGHGRMGGGTLWANYRLNMLPGGFNGLGVEIEGRDISLGGNSTQSPNFRQDTAGGGLTYSWRRYKNFFPYGKFLVQLGSFDFNLGSPYYTHDTRTVYTPGLGIEYRAHGHIWVRADYEYQTWPLLFRKNNSLNPQGFTGGVAYHF